MDKLETNDIRSATVDDITREEFISIRRNFRMIALVALVVLLIGAVFYHEVEHLNWLNAFYFCTITLTTIGYGDIVPHTDAGKIFTIFYVIVGIGIIAAFANMLLKNAIARRQYKHLTMDTKSTTKRGE